MVQNSFLAFIYCRIHRPVQKNFDITGIFYDDLMAYKYKALTEIFHTSG